MGEELFSITVQDFQDDFALTAVYEEEKIVSVAEGIVRNLVAYLISFSKSRNIDLKRIIIEQWKDSLE